MPPVTKQGLARRTRNTSNISVSRANETSEQGSQHLEANQIAARLRRNRQTIRRRSSTQLLDTSKPSTKNMSHPTSKHNISNQQLTEEKQIKSEIETKPTTIQYNPMECDIDSTQNKPPDIKKEEVFIKTEIIDPEIDTTPTIADVKNIVTHRNTQNQSTDFHSNNAVNVNPNVKVKEEYEIKIEIPDYNMASTSREIMAKNTTINTRNESSIVLSSQNTNNIFEVNLKIALKSEIKDYAIRITSEITDYEIETTPTTIQFITKEIKDETVEQNSLENGNEESLEGGYKCETCKVGFLSHENHQMHMQCHFAVSNNGPPCSSSSPLQHKCTMCDIMFPNEREFIMHCRGTHEELQPIRRRTSSIEPESNAVKVEDIENASENTTQHEQLIVDNPETEKSLLESHARSNTSERPYKCDVCDKVFTTCSSLKAHSVIHGEKLHRCNVCDKRFTKISHLKEHVRTHTGERPYKCYICNKGLSSSSNLKTHLKKHNGETPYKCNVCDKRFTIWSRLKVHSQTHGEKIHRCTVCNKGFTKVSHLKTHAVIHTGERPHTCNICNSGFTTSRSLKRHLHLLHTSETPFKCKLCNQMFTAISILKAHFKNTHSDFKPHQCNVCNKSFSKASTLKSHTIVHTGERPYECNLCNVRCTTSSHLKSHLRTHNNERPFKCNLCDKAYTRNKHLRVHLTTHSSD